MVHCRLSLRGMQVARMALVIRRVSRDARSAERSAILIEKKRSAPKTTRRG